jgi:4-coumarate--CoA ligase
MASEHIYRSPNPDAVLPHNLSFHQFLAKYNPDDVPLNKLIFEDNSAPKKTITYGGLREAAAIAAGGFVNKYGLKKGDSVAILGANSVDWALLAHSIMWFGGICV